METTAGDPPPLRSRLHREALGQAEPARLGAVGDEGGFLRSRHVIHHPTQPLAKDEHGTIRFQQNAIVRYLLDAGPFDMNHLARMDFSDADRAQFAQLIGYSLSGFGELSYVDDAAYERASMAARIGDAGGELPMPTTRTMNEFEANLLDALRMFLQSEL